MNHIQTILTSAIDRIKEGSTVADITEVSARNYTFTTDDLKNVRVGLSVIIGGVRYTVTAIDTKTKTVSIYGFELPIGNEWQLALFFRYGSRIEINQLLTAENQANKNIFPFIWLILNYQQQPLPEFGKDAYSTEIKLFFVNSSTKGIIAEQRFEQNIETIFDNLTELFFNELNTLPTAASFVRTTKEPIAGKMIDRYFFGSQENNTSVIAVDQTDARECDIALKVIPYSAGCNSPFKPALVPTFSYVDNSDAEAFTDELFTARIALTNTTNDLRLVPYSITFDWGVLGKETFEGILQFGESINLESAKILTGVTESFTVLISGSVTDSITKPISLPEFIDILTFNSLNINQTYSVFLNTSTPIPAKFSDGVAEYTINNNSTFNYLSKIVGDINLLLKSAVLSNITVFSSNTRRVKSVLPELMTELLGFYCSNNLLTSVDLSKNIKLTTIQLQGNQITDLDISNNIALTSVNLENNKLAAFDISNNPNIAVFIAYNNLFTQAAIDSILYWFVQHNVAAPSQIRLEGAGNAAPSATGLTYKATLQGRGWFVATN